MNRQNYILEKQVKQSKDRSNDLIKKKQNQENQIKDQNSLFLKTSKELEDTCNTTMNLAIKIHDKSLKDTFDESLDKLKEELKKKVTKDLVEVEQIEEEKPIMFKLKQKQT